MLLDVRQSWVRTVLQYIESIEKEDVLITVLIAEIIPRRPWHQLLHQRGRPLEAMLKARTDVVVARLPFRLHD